MDNNGLLFIPDISGFTKFVNEIEIEHSRYIIGELLGNIINSNQMRLAVSEIEGDAVLFYRLGKAPLLDEVYGQVENMFCNFQKQLQNYETRRACQCKACVAAINLSLKIITHYGEFSTYNVEKYKKLIGKDVIVAHQLLKNDIDLHEYWLVTDDLFNNNKTVDNLPAWMKWQQGSVHTGAGETGFHYLMLAPLKDSVKPDPLSKLGLGSRGVKLAGQHKIIDAPLLTVLSIIGNFSLRSKWMEGVTSVDQVSHPINHLGVRHRSFMESRSVIYYTSSFDEVGNTFTYSETDEDKTVSKFFTLEKLSDDQTMLAFDYYEKKRTCLPLYFSLFKRRKLVRRLASSLENIQALCSAGV